jgi:adenylate cyclase
LSISGQLRALNFRDYHGGLELLDRALRASPNSPIAWARSATVYSYIGNGNEARRRAEQALRLSPFDPHLFFTHVSLTIAAYVMADYETAIDWASRAYAQNPKYTPTLRFLAASLAAVGRIEDARLIAQEHIQLEPGFRAREFSQAYAFQNAALRLQLGQHLVSAGHPE